MKTPGTSAEGKALSLAAVLTLIAIFLLGWIWLRHVTLATGTRGGGVLVFAVLSAIVRGTEALRNRNEADEKLPNLFNVPRA